MKCERCNGTGRTPIYGFICGCTTGETILIKEKNEIQSRQQKVILLATELFNRGIISSEAWEFGKEAIMKELSDLLRSNKFL